MNSGSEASPQTDNIDNLLSIFTIRTMRDLKKHCRAATVGKAHLASFIEWCGSGNAPYLHTARHRHFHPEHLTLSDTDLAALAGNGVGKFKPAAQKAVNKVYATFDERRMLSGHLFWDARTCPHWGSVTSSIAYLSVRYPENLLRQTPDALRKRRKACGYKSDQHHEPRRERSTPQQVFQYLWHNSSPEKDDLEKGNNISEQGRRCKHHVESRRRGAEVRPDGVRADIVPVFSRISPFPEKPGLRLMIVATQNSPEPFRFAR